MQELLKPEPFGAFQQSLGVAHFIGQTDLVGRAVLALLLIMSIASWTVIIVKSVRLALRHLQSRRFVQAFRSASDLPSVQSSLRESQPRDPFAELVRDASSAVEQVRGASGSTVVDPGATNEFVTRALGRSIAATTTQLESGLTILASVGSAAPFVGLFGTVWGIYHALLAIGLSGQGTLDKVAGPVGEALIMTALGLAVAIPAVLAYNAFVRSNRVTIATLERFAHDVFGRIVMQAR